MHYYVITRVINIAIIIHLHICILGGEKPLLSTKNTSKTACVLEHRVQKTWAQKNWMLCPGRMSVLHIYRSVVIVP